MRFPQNVGSYIRMYEALPSLLSRPYDPDSGDEALAALCNRDAMADEVSLDERLAELDIRLAEALATADDDWTTTILGWADACRFASSPWWVAVTQRAGLRELAPAAR